MSNEEKMSKKAWLVYLNPGENKERNEEIKELFKLCQEKNVIAIGWAHLPQNLDMKDEGAIRSALVANGGKDRDNAKKYSREIYNYYNNMQEGDPVIFSSFGKVLVGNIKSGVFPASEKPEDLSEFEKHYPRIRYVNWIIPTPSKVSFTHGRSTVIEISHDEMSNTVEKILIHLPQNRPLLDGWGLNPGKILSEREDKSLINLITSDTNFENIPSEEMEEGRKKLVKHYIRERKPKIKKDAINLRISEGGALDCDACRFSFLEKYGKLGEGYVEAHHKKPISEMKPGDKTNLKDIALLCANCHRMVHRNFPPLKIEDLKSIISKK